MLIEPNSTAGNFALMIDTACRDFEAFLAFARGDAWVQSKDEWESSKVMTAATMALAKSFAFNVIRAARICRHGASELPLTREERKELNRIGERVLPVRDVNEHGFDRHRKGGSDPVRPSLHLHEEFSAAVDETGLVTLDEHTVLMGSLNLRDVYNEVKPFQVKYGQHSLADPRLPR